MHDNMVVPCYKYQRQQEQLGTTKDTMMSEEMSVQSSLHSSFLVCVAIKCAAFPTA